MNNNKFFTRMLAVILTALALFGLPSSAASIPITTLRVTPAEASATTCTETQIVVQIEEVENLWAYHVEMTYDPGALEITGLENGGFLHDGTLITMIDNDIGRFFVAYFQVGYELEPITGSGNLAIIKLRARTQGVSTPLSFNSESGLSDRNGFSIAYQAVSGVVNTVSCAEEFIYLPLVLR